MEPGTGDPPRVPLPLVHPLVGLAKTGTFWQGGGRVRHRPPLGPGRGRAPRLQPPAVRSREPPGCWPGKCPCAGPPRARIVPLNLGSVFGALRLPSRRRKGKNKNLAGLRKQDCATASWCPCHPESCEELFWGCHPLQGPRDECPTGVTCSRAAPVPPRLRFGEPGEGARGLAVSGRASLAEEVGER